MDQCINLSVLYNAELLRLCQLLIDNANTPDERTQATGFYHFFKRDIDKLSDGAKLNYIISLRTINNEL